MNGKKHYNLNITDDNGKSITTTNVSTEHPDELARILALAGVDHVESDVVVEPDCGCNEPDEFKASGVVVGDTDDFNAHHVEILDDERMMEAVDIYGNQMPDANSSVNDEDRKENEVEDDDDDDEKVDIELDDDEDDEEDKEQLNAEDEDPTDDESKEAEFKGSSAQDGDLDDYSKKTANSISRQKKHLVPGGDNALSYSESVEEIEAALIAEAKKFEEACAKKKMKEASWIDGKKQKSTDMVWKSVQMSYDDAVAKYGKDKVKKGMFKRGTGEEDVQVRMPLGEGRMKDQLWDKAEMMDLEDFVANAGDFGMDEMEASEFWKTANGMDESEVNEDFQEERELDIQGIQDTFYAMNALDEPRALLGFVMQHHDPYLAKEFKQAWAAGEYRDFRHFKEDIIDSTIHGMFGDGLGDVFEPADISLNDIKEESVNEAPGDYPNVVSTKPGDGDYEKGFMYVDTVTGELYKTHPGYEVKGSYDDFVAGRGEVQSGGDFAHMSDEELQDAINDAMEQGDQGAAEEYYAELEKRSMGESQVNEEEVEEGNAFSKALADAKKAGKKEFEVDGKTHQVKESDYSKVSTLSSAEYQKAKKRAGFDASAWKWDSDQDLYVKKSVSESDEKCDKCGCSPCECDHVKESEEIARLRKLSGL